MTDDVYTGKRGDRVVLSFAGDVLSVTYFEPQQTEPTARVRTRGQESGAIIATLRLAQELEETGPQG